MFFIGFIVVGEYQTFAGQLARFFSGQAEQHYQFAILVSLIGILFSILGFVTVLYGAIAKD